MSAQSDILWCDATWNPAVGCTKISPGCRHCYAETMACRLASMGHEQYEQVTARGRWNGEVAFMPSVLRLPLKWRKPKVIFPCSMGDMFHESMPFSMIDLMYAVMALTPQHRYMVLTKRHRCMAEYWSKPRDLGDAINYVRDGNFQLEGEITTRGALGHVWHGVTACIQSEVDAVVKSLIWVPGNRFISAEPMLESLTIKRYAPILNLVVCGGESGPKARPMHPDWVRDLRDQCARTDTPFCFKQWGAWLPDKKRIFEGVRSVIWGDTVIHKVGAKAAGRELDGCVHDGHLVVREGMGN